MKLVFCPCWRLGVNSNLVILTGGLGPTEDDLTKQTLAKFLGKDLVFDPQAQEKLDIFFAQRPDYARTHQ